jgi:thiamine kinase-like enzyme
MVTNSTSPISAIDTSTLTPVVRRALGRDSFQIEDWHAIQLGGGFGNPVSVGLYRFEGSGQDSAGNEAWSVILKVIQSPDNVGVENMGGGDDTSHWNYWKREPLIYQSGFLDSLPHDMTAPRFYGTVDLPGNVTWLWLEDMTGASEAKSLEDYALTARHLGQFNGMHASNGSLPTHPWLGKHRLQQWIDTTILWRDFSWDHPHSLQHYGKADNSFRRLLADHERFFAKLERLPKTICHGDTYPTNFMYRHLPNGKKQTLALDWALTAIAPLGEDLGQLIYGAQTNLKDIDRIEVDKVLFESYLDGLQDSNCRIDPTLVRFGFAAMSALQVGLFQLFVLSLNLNDEVSSEQTTNSDPFEIIMANEAFQLL